MRKSKLIRLLKQSLDTQNADLREHEELRSALLGIVGEKGITTKLLRETIPDNYEVVVDSPIGTYAVSKRGRRHLVWRHLDHREFSLSIFDENNTMHCNGPKDRSSKILDIITCPATLERYREMYSNVEKAVRILSDLRCSRMDYLNPINHDICRMIIREQYVRDYYHEELERIIY